MAAPSDGFFAGRPGDSNGTLAARYERHRLRELQLHERRHMDDIASAAHLSKYHLARHIGRCMACRRQRIAFESGFGLPSA